MRFLNAQRSLPAVVIIKNPSPFTPLIATLALAAVVLFY
jgi:hypothetical protein